MSGKKKPTKEERATQFIAVFRQKCDDYGIPHDNAYLCMEKLQQCVRNSHGKTSFKTRMDYLTILDVILCAPNIYFDRYYNFEYSDIDDFDTNGRSAAKTVLEYEKQSRKRKGTQEQNVVAVYIGYMKRKMKTERKSPLNPWDEKLAKAIILGLRYQFADTERLNGKNRFEQLVLMDRDELTRRTGKYNSAFDLFEDYLPQYISDGCFVALLPYFLFYHLAYAAKLINRHSFEENNNSFAL